LLRLAKEWHLTPSEFRRLPYDEQVEMMAEMSVTNDMMAYEEHIAERKRKAKG
jgi:hypothetical protein